MLQWRQIHTIVQKLTGQPVAPQPPDHLRQPWLTIYQTIYPPGDPILYERELWRATQGLPNRRPLIQAILDALPDPDACRPFPSLHDLAAGLPPVSWLWPTWLPRGMLTLLGAAPGVGKSLVALDLARRIIHGQPFPDGAPIPRPGANILYVDAEAIPQIQNQRALAWQLDRSRLYLMLPPQPYALIDLGDQEQQDTLTQMAYEIQPELLIVDSLSSISLKGENNIEDVRTLLSFLSALAREFDLALLLIHHLRKRGKGAPLTDPVTADDFRGSGHIIAIARSVLALSLIQTGPEPDRNGPRRLEVIKTNLCQHPPPLGLHLQPGHPGAPTLHYTEPPQPYRDPTQAELCAAWLQDYLSESDQPVKPKEIVHLAEQAGYTRGVLYRARDLLGDAIADTHPKRHPDNRWTLAE